TDRVTIFIGLAQVVAAALLVAFLPVHLGHHVVEMAKIIGGDQARRNSSRRTAFKDRWIKIEGAQVFATGGVIIFFLEMGSTQVAVKAGIGFCELQGSFILLHRGTITLLFVIEDTKIVVSLRIVAIAVDGFLEFLFGVMPALQLQERDSDFVVQNGSVGLF